MDKALKALGPEVLEGIMFAAYPWPLKDSENDPEILDFIFRFQSSFGVRPNLYAAMGYDALKVLATVLEKANPRVVVRALYTVFVLPHGVIELTAIFMGGGAGFLLSTALLLPGDLTRKNALVLRGRQAVRLTLGCVPLLIVAGVVEGFFSPVPLPAELKFLVAGILLALLLGYLLFPVNSARTKNR